MVSSTPTASTAPILPSSASNNAWPQRMTSLLTVCQSQPSSLATADTVRPSRPAISAAHRAARLVNNPRSGAIRGSCSVNEPAPQPLSGHSRRCFRQPSRTGRPNAGRPSRLYQPLALGPHLPPAPGARRTGTPDGADLHQQSPVQGFARLQYLHSPQSGHHLAYALILALHQGSSSLGKHFSASDYGGPHPRSRGFPTPSQPTTPPSFPKSRKTPPPRPASRARPPPPPPWIRTRSVSTRQGRVRKMIPVSVCAGGGPEVLWLLHYPASVRHSQYPCRRI